ncbi:MAG: DUF3575 domain-containing protein [Polyangiaceae bacterium]
MRAALGPPAILLLVVSAVAIASPAMAQVNLPPPPPPPLENGGTGSGSTSGTTTAPAGTHKPKPHTKPEPPPPTHTAPVVASHENRTPPPPPRVYEPEAPRMISIRLNPLPFFLSRLSVDFEFMVAPHHALFASPNVTFHKFAFHRSEVIADALGYAGDTSSGFGGEIGYHYWVHRQLEGIYVGPAFVFGETTPNGGKAFGYYGGAVDVGYQYLFSNGFTLNGGGGIMLVGASGTPAHAAPRFLFGIGWSF